MFFVFVEQIENEGQTNVSTRHVVAKIFILHFVRHLSLIDLLENILKLSSCINLMPYWVLYVLQTKFYKCYYNILPQNRMGELKHRYLCKNKNGIEVSPLLAF